MTRQFDVRARACQVAQERLLRERKLLQAVTPAERDAIEETVYSIAFKVADCIFDEAARWASLAATPAAGPFTESNRRHAPDSPVPV